MITAFEVVVITAIIRRSNVILLISVQLLADNCPGLRPCCAGLDALGPRVTKFCVTSTSAVSEPRTPATAATTFTGFADGAAFGAHGTGDRHGCSCLYVGMDQRPKEKNATIVTF